MTQTFDAVGVGISNLVLNNMRLTGSTGSPGGIFEITPVSLENGKITVAPVPTPASLSLLLTSLAALIGIRRFGTKESI